MGTLCCGTFLTVPGLTTPGLKTPGRTGLLAVAAGPEAEPSPRPPAPIPQAHAHLFAPVRTRLWELPEALHCSVVGTCLSTAALVKLLSRLGLVRPGDTEHELHGRAVSLAGQRTENARRLHKLLDTMHAAAVRALNRAGTEAELRQMWSDALERGDVPGPYWAVLTHPACSYALRQDAFGRVHMLSHLVGAANRADLRRLAELENDNARLRGKVDRQQARLQSTAAESGATIRLLRDALSQQPPRPGETPDGEVVRGLLADLRRRLDASERRGTALDARLADARTALTAERTRRHAAERQAEAAQAELAATEAALPNGSASAVPPPDLSGVSLLYVGGRTQAVATLHGLAARLGAGFAHHDGGMEDGAGLLPGLVNRADVVLFPVDCISHEAALAVKRLCRHAGKPFVPLRSAGLGSFLAALRTVRLHPAVACPAVACPAGA